jgi:lipid-binding SYLF domain-containing protein
MPTYRSLLVVIFATLGVGAALAQDAGNEAAERRAEIDANAKTTLDHLFESQPDAKTLFDHAAGYAVFTATKAGFIVSGGSGTGVAIDKSTGQHTYMRMGLGGIGLGIGAQRYSLVVMFETSEHLNKFVAGGWDSSATAEAAAAKEGVSARSSFMNGVAYYQLTNQGLMAHADVTGTKFWPIEDLNNK